MTTGCSTETSDRESGADPLRGLSTAEVARRRASGESAVASLPTSRGYGDIVRENVFDFINSVLFLLGLALVVLGRPGDALVSIGVVLANSLVGVVQEVRAKWTLDRIALLTAPKATVVRDGRVQVVDAGEVVRGDVLRLCPGDQIVADGQILTGRSVEIDESLLTGESRPVRKAIGDPVTSGSFCVAGDAAYVATVIGRGSLATQLTEGARAFRREYTPLQREIHRVIRVVLLVALFLELLIVVDAAIDQVPIVETVAMSVVVLGIVPNGLVLAIAVAYGAAAIRMVGQGVLIGEANAIESLSHVDILCLDKTGTLTTGRLQLAEIYPLGISLADLRQQVGQFAAGVSAPNRTIVALGQAFPSTKANIRVEVPFSSARRWSAITVGTPTGPETYVLGAMDALVPSLEPSVTRDELIQTWTDRGLRVLVLARTPGPSAEDELDVEAKLPPRLVALGVIGLADELRPEARATLSAFQASGIQLKLVSGDDPRTVTSLARQVGFATTTPATSGADLAGLSHDDWEDRADSVSVFGRVAPDQKSALIQALRHRGHHVAMVGDGVNDVLALKQANLGIALGSGSAAARAVAGLVLLEDAFGALPGAVREGQRIQTGMYDILKLFLTRVLSIALLLVGTGFVDAFPLVPKQNALLTFLTVGIPSVALAAWARPDAGSAAGALRQVFHFVLPAAVTLALVELGTHLFAFLSVASALTPTVGATLARSQAILVAQSAVTSVGILGGLLLIVFVEPPSPAWVGGDRLSSDRRPSLLALGLGLLYGFILAVPGLRAFFTLYPLNVTMWLLLVATIALWALVLRWLWRTRLVERFLGVEWD
jgi:cation-transporting ATPase E